jgi:predicted DNA-binding protein
MAVITFRLEDETAYALQKLSNCTGKSKSHFIKTGLQMYLRHFLDKEADERTLAVLREFVGYLVDFYLPLNPPNSQTKQTKVINYIPSTEV